MDDEVKRLLKVMITIGYKLAKTAENFGESSQPKYSDILDLLVAKYLSPEKIINAVALHVLLPS